MKVMWQGKMSNHLQRSKRKVYKNCKSFSQQYVRQKTIVSPHIISSDNLGLTDHCLASLSTSRLLSSAHHSISGGTKWDSLMTTPVQPPVTTFPSLPNHLCDRLLHRQVDPISLFKISHSAFINPYKSKFPFFARPFASKFNI